MKKTTKKRQHWREKRIVLDGLAHTRLSEITKHFELDVRDKRLRDSHISSLTQARDLNVENILGLFKFAELKQVHQQLGIESGGRTKVALVDGLVRFFESSKPRAHKAKSKPAAPSRRRSATASKAKTSSPARSSEQTVASENINQSQELPAAAVSSKKEQQQPSVHAVGATPHRTTVQVNQRPNLASLEMETATLLGDAVAEVTRLAIIPELKPFKDSVNTLCTRLTDLVEEVSDSTSDLAERLPTISASLNQFSSRLEKLEAQFALLSTIVDQLERLGAGEPPRPSGPTL